MSIEIFKTSPNGPKVWYTDADAEEDILEAAAAEGFDVDFSNQVVTDLRNFSIDPEAGAVVYAAPLVLLPEEGAEVEETPDAK